jgi:hypothetical protein
LSWDLQDGFSGIVVDDSTNREGLSRFFLSGLTREPQQIPQDAAAHAEWRTDHWESPSKVLTQNAQQRRFASAIGTGEDC